jgi:hypothetical protein
MSFVRLFALLGILVWSAAVLAAPPPWEAKKIKLKETFRSFTGVLAEGDAKDKVLAKPCKVIPLKMVKGSAYLIDLKSPAFDPIVRVTTSRGLELDRNDNAEPKTSAARLDFIAARDDEYQIIVSTADGKFGSYTLSVAPLGRPGDPGVTLLEAELTDGAKKKHAFEVKKERKYTVDLMVLDEVKTAGLTVENVSGSLRLKGDGSEIAPRRARVEFMAEADETVQIGVAAEVKARYLVRIREVRVFTGTITPGPEAFSLEQELTDADPKDTKRKTCHCKLFKVKMQAGASYEIRLRAAEGASFDPFLRLENPEGKEVAWDDDSDDGNNARIVFPCKADGVYQIVATSFVTSTGAFTLSVREVKKGK